MNPHHLRAIRRKILRQLRFPVLLLPFAVIHLKFQNPRPNSDMIATFKANWREFVLFAVALALVFLRAFSDYVGGLLDMTQQLATLSNFLAGITYFAGAHAVAVIGMMLWANVNRFGNGNFTRVWESLTEKERLDRYMAVFAAEILCASICFSVGT